MNGLEEKIIEIIRAHPDGIKSDKVIRGLENCQVDVNELEVLECLIKLTNDKRIDRRSYNKACCSVCQTVYEYYPLEN